ncbi:ATPase, T2SS/T4P/T4SS family, partial [Verrucomicrobiales bacterium]|nr:ATPase, T2SS/T4P/T4SS family [Verrucomicrobiales bacterium]
MNFLVFPDFLPQDFCTSNHIALLDDPSDEGSQDIRIGVLDPEDQDLISEAQEIIGKDIKPIQLNAYEISKALSQIYNIEAESVSGPMLHLNSSLEINFSKDRKPNLILQDILSIALQRGSTDIHIENYNEDVDMRLRIDGTLHQVTTSLSPSNIQRVIACLKMACDLDHLERKKSQDGRFSALYDDDGNSRRVDFRASIVPGNHGQEAVIRVLDPQRFILDIDELGMPTNVLNS